MNKPFDRTFLQNNRSSRPDYLTDTHEWAIAPDDTRIAVSGNRKAAMMIADGSELPINRVAGLDCYGIPNNSGELIWSPCYHIHASAWCCKCSVSAYIRAADKNFNNVDRYNLEWFPYMIEDAQAIIDIATINHVSPQKVPVGWLPNQCRSVTIKQPQWLNVTSWHIAQIVNHPEDQVQQLLQTLDENHAGEQSTPFSWTGMVITLDGGGYINTVTPKLSYGIEAYELYVEYYVAQDPSHWESYTLAREEGWSLPLLFK